MTAHCLYIITLPDGRAYIGVTKDIGRRFRVHCWGRRSAVNDAIKQVGRDKISLRTLAVGKRDFIFDLEQRAILTFGTRWPAGLNIADGGYGGRDPLPITRAKLSASRKGQIASEETRLRLSIAHKGKTFPNRKSPQTRPKGFFGTPANLKGRPWSEARRAAQERRHNVCFG